MRSHTRQDFTEPGKTKYVTSADINTYRGNNKNREIPDKADDVQDAVEIISCSEHIPIQQVEAADNSIIILCPSNLY